MLFIMLFFCSNYAKKYAFCPKLCLIILHFAQLCFAPEVHVNQHSRPEQNLCLFCRNPYGHCKHRRHSGTGASQDRSPKEKRKRECCKLLSSHYFSTGREGERERERERERESERERLRPRLRLRERERT